MAAVDLPALTTQVQAILADPHAKVPPTGNRALDDALAALGQHRRAKQPLPGPQAQYWDLVPQPVHVHAQ